jgi:hypothetical protein
MQTTASPSSRTPAGRFAPGVSGNPAGRPTGARNRASLIEDALRDGEAEAIVRRMVELALDGDRAALRFCAERLLPRPKGRPIELDLAARQESDPAAVIAAALRAVADGEVTPDEALALGRLVAQRERALRATPPVSNLYSSPEAAAKPRKNYHQERERHQAPRASNALGALGVLDGEFPGLTPEASKSPVLPGASRAALLASASARALAA